MDTNSRQRRFVGTGRQIGKYLNMALRKTDVDLCHVNENGYIFLTAGKHKEVRERGITDWVAEDDYKPAPKEEFTQEA